MPPSGELYAVMAGVVCLQVKLSDPHPSALEVRFSRVTTKRYTNLRLPLPLVNANKEVHRRLQGISTSNGSDLERSKESCQRPQPVDETCRPMSQTGWAELSLKPRIHQDTCSRIQVSWCKRGLSLILTHVP